MIVDGAEITNNTNPDGEFTIFHAEDGATYEIRNSLVQSNDNVSVSTLVLYKICTTFVFET